MLCPKRLVLSSFIVGNDLIGSIQNIPGRAVILLQFDNDSIRIIIFKFKDIPYIRAAPAVYALVIITDHAKIPAFSCQQSQQLILCTVGILILIDHDIPEASAIDLQDRGMVRQEQKRFQQQVVKIKRIHCFHALFIFGHDIMNHGGSSVPQ